MNVILAILCAALCHLVENIERLARELRAVVETAWAIAVYLKLLELDDVDEALEAHKCAAWRLGVPL